MFPVILLEKLVATELSRYLESTAQLHPHQAAYRLGRSTEDILRVAVDIISNSIDSDNSVCAAFLDFKKAFDLLDHCILLQTLSELGVSNTALSWFKNYLTDRFHRVKCQGKFSSWKMMYGGIPQGSALGPLLFLIYINTLPSTVSDGVLLQYADDTTLICCGKDPLTVATSMNRQLHNVQTWLVDNRMQLNIKKSCVIWFHTRRQKNWSYPDIMVDDVKLQVATKQKYCLIQH